jgi:hypothetical protein
LVHLGILDAHRPIARLLDESPLLGGQSGYGHGGFSNWSVPQDKWAQKAAAEKGTTSCIIDGSLQH